MISIIKLINLYYSLKYSKGYTSLYNNTTGNEFDYIERWGWFNCAKNKRLEIIIYLIKAKLREDIRKIK